MEEEEVGKEKERERGGVWGRKGKEEEEKYFGTVCLKIRKRAKIRNRYN